MKKLFIYNSLTRRKEEFISLHEGFAGIYVCGPTVYGHAHLGHAKSYISFDIVVRFLRHLGYKVRYVQNITDVGHLTDDADAGEDKIGKQAQSERLQPMEIVETYTRSFFADMDALNVLRPDISPRASGHIPEQLELTQMLLEKGFAYEVNGNVYFDVSKYSAYGKLSGRSVADLLEGTRIEVNTEKRHPADFALWKKAGPEHIMQWNSPWGSGFPGWHVECSAMSTKYLGQPFDIHGGGLENTFPHHECEIAQSEAATGKTFARYWMHNNMVTVNGVKMGKSLGNFITIHQAMENLEPMAIRFFILSSHYRSPLDFSDDALTAGQKGFQKILTFLRRVTELVPATDAGIRLEQVVSDYQVAFENELCDDFNTPKALAVVFDFIREMNSLFDQDDRLNPVDQAGLINVLRRTVGDVLGLLPDAVLSNKEQGGDFSGVMELLLELRQILRREKNFALADQIRQKLTELKIEIKDTADGSRWEKK